MHHFCVTLSFFCLLLISSCGSTSKNTDTPADKPANDAEATTQTFFIGPKRVDCEDARPRKCFLIKDQLQDDWRYLYTSIRGLDYQEGFTYEVKVRVTTIEEPAPDQHPLVYNLVKVLSKKEAKDDRAVGSDLELVVYEAYTRGSFLRVEADDQEIRYYKSRNDATPTSQTLNASEWAALYQNVAALDLPTLPTLAAPSNRRASDGALAAQIKITNKNGEYASIIFDHKNPPKALEPLANQLLSMIEGLK
jgi:hypothetical protein